MPKVGIVMGSDSDMKVMSQAADFLKDMGIDFEIRIISAHREPEVFFFLGKNSQKTGLKVFI